MAGEPAGGSVSHYDVDKLINLGHVKSALEAADERHTGLIADVADSTADAIEELADAIPTKLSDLTIDTEVVTAYLDSNSVLHVSNVIYIPRSEGVAF